MKKVVLAFSGGLDTSYCAIYLAKEMGLEVHAALANTGGFSAEELARIEKRAYALGVKSYVALDVTQDYYQHAIKYMIFGNVLKNSTYPISVSSERISQATAIARYAREIGADYLCHGSTGAGNDQVRFDMIFNIVAPEIEVIALIREKRLSREEEIEYLRSHGVDFDFKKAEYSINQGIWGTSVGGKETLTSSETLPEEAYPSQLKEPEPRRVTLTFERGEFVALDGKRYDDRIAAIQALQAVASRYAVGRDMHVGDTIIGIKGRVGFEAAAPMVIIKAYARKAYADEMAAFLEGPDFGLLRQSSARRTVLRSGHARHGGHAREQPADRQRRRVRRSAPLPLRSRRYRQPARSDEQPLRSDWTSEDVKGFGRIFGNQNKIYYQVNKEKL